MPRIKSSTAAVQTPVARLPPPAREMFAEPKIAAKDAPSSAEQRLGGLSQEALESLDLKQALALIDAADGDEMLAAFSLAAARNRRAGATDDSPDDLEVHHALAALRKARGLVRPSFDHVRSQLRTVK